MTNLSINPFWFEIVYYTTEWTNKGPITKKITLFENRFITF